MLEGQFDFLGYTFGRMYSKTIDMAYIGLRPSKKCIRRMVERAHDLTDLKTGWQETTEKVDKLNRALRGWANYFSLGTTSGAYRVERRWKQRRQRGLRQPASGPSASECPPQPPAAAHPAARALRSSPSIAST